MSADNTVLILETADGFFRVIHTQNAEELYLNENEDDIFGSIFLEDFDIEKIMLQVENISKNKENVHSEGNSLNPYQVYNFFHNSPVFYSMDIATKYAFKLYDEAGYVEYGIQTVKCPLTWADIEKVANENE